MKIVGLIPARGASKHLPGKNIKTLQGKPLIAYTIEEAIQNKNIERVIVSTDSKKIANISKKYGAEVPFLRPKRLALDNTPDRPVILHLLNWLKENDNYDCELLVYLRPTTPFRTQNIINACIETLINNEKYTSVRTVTRAEGVNHPYWMYKVEDGIMSPFLDNIDISKYYQRQLLPECFRLNGVVDVLKTKVILKSHNYFGDRMGFVEIDELESIDIDTESDFKFCEFIINSAS
jgi:CMP-N-acetylneuraminic acid synthetase